MAFKIQDLMIDVVPGGGAIRWADTTLPPPPTNCVNPSCQGPMEPTHCPHPTCQAPPPPKPKPPGAHAVPADLLLLRQQLRQALSPDL